MVSCRANKYFQNTQEYVSNEYEEIRLDEYDFSDSVDALMFVRCTREIQYQKYNQYLQRVVYTTAKPR
jgi:hypothetical protein